MSDFWHHSTKYDGSLHYRYPVQVIEAGEKQLITYCPPGAAIESYRGCWTGTKHLLSLFWRERPYVLHFRWEGQWQPEFLYVDISAATSWDNGTARYIDMDLDLILRPGSATHLDDEDEFEAHRMAWNYPQELVADCWKAVEEVRGLLAKGEKPFSLTMLTWRPGEALGV